MRTQIVVVGLIAALLPPALPAQGRSGAMLEEIVVTARKREESLQDAPIAVSAFSGEALEFRGVEDIDRLDQFVPNLVLNESPTYSNMSNAAVYIRGIGQNDFTPVIDPGVGIYVDGVYLGRSVGAVLDIVDIERIEVLRGPQGTLFGRNTIGGAITLTSKQPEEEFGGNVDVKYGTDDRFNVRATVNAPLVENLYARLSLASFQQDGYVTRPFDGKDLGDDDTLGARFALRWLPAPNVDLNWSIDYSRDRQNGNPYVLTGIQPLNIGLVTSPTGAPSMSVAANTIAAQLATGGPASFVGGEFFDVTDPTGFPFQFNACFDPSNATNPVCFNQQWLDNGDKELNFGTDPHFQNLDVWGTAGTADWEINDNLTAKLIASYRGFESQAEGDQDGSPLRVSYLIDIYQHHQQSYELQVLGTSFDDRLDWILGGYYFQEDGKNINPVRFALVYLQSGGYYDADSWAVFAQGTWHFNDKLDLTFGMRYTEDTRDYRPDQYIEFFPVGPLPVFCPPGSMNVCQVGDRPLPLETVTESTNEWVPMVNLSYRWTDGLMTYFTYSEGFKSGGYTQRIFPPEVSTPSFDPEFVTSYEGGFKFDGFDGRVRLNVAAFFTDYTDLQLLVADPSRLGPFVSNAGDAEVIGVEIETVVSPAEGWFISGSAGLSDIDRTDLEGTVQGITLDSPFQHISEWTANAQIYKELPIGDWGYLTPRFEWSYRTEWGTNSNNTPRLPPDVVDVGPFAGVPLSFGVPNPALEEDDLHLLNASIRWDVGHYGLSFTLGGTNLTDEEYTIFGNYQDGFGFTNETFHRGREWYIQGAWEF
jgi:iron complex outermembrane receptor protein